MIPLVVIRPQPGADATAAAAVALGLDPRVFPLFEIRPHPWDAPDPDQIDALLVGSANALRNAGTQLQRYRGKPAYAVGQATAAACLDAGLTVAAAGTGGLGRVLRGITGPRRLLRLAGRDHVALQPPPGVTMVERIVYTSEPRPVPAPLGLLLRSPVAILLHSAVAAQHFAAECARLDLDRSRLALATIGPRVTAVCGGGWAEVATATFPDDAALLAQAVRLCQNFDGTPGSAQGQRKRECKTNT